ncbi:extracellular solute-binding protein [Rhizobium sp. LC145]|uniref:ABC transporter substrate-binding protein n=1 Tax=Rhizobium sp. LC145 TaxID=1120688 RepID=UPI00062A30AD|nr:extracellular solute-binding protein [Rhizobium sp. LC145]KKX33343.1 sugar ABC transporter substrate-binding protein [Rhizobium sp. LC145]TKT43791.1 extracellular solute-binding protein [Rhizobiaceae bacterium LC148]
MKNVSVKNRISTRGRLLGMAFGAAMLSGLSSASAQTLTVWSGYPEMAPFYEHVAQGLKASHPDLEVKVEAIALREHEKRVALGLTGGQEGITVIELSGSTATRYLENGLLPEAPDDVAAFVTDPQNFDTFFRDTASYDGTVYGVPLFRGQGALYYNTDMFKAAGLTEPPKTMEDYSRYAEKLTQRDGSGKATVSGWSLRLSGGGQGIAEKFWINMHQYGGAILVPAGDGKWKADFANEAGRKALKQYLENIYTLKTVTPEMPADADAFERGQTAMFIRESWVIGDIAKKAPDLKYATAPLPKGSIALPTNLYVAGDDADIGWEFAQAANSPENLVWLLENVGWLPNRSGVDYSSVTTKQPAFAAFVNYPQGYEFFTLPSIGPIEEILTRVAAQLVVAFGDASMASDDAKIDAFLKKASDEVNTILDREGLAAK